jgi:hypothetical protein
MKRRRRNKEKTFSLKFPMYPQNNYNASSRICLEGVANVSKMMGNIFSTSCNVGK